MIRLRIAPLLLALCVCIASNQDVSAAEPDHSEVVQQLTAGNNQFALALYAKLKDQEGNLFFSPYSISSALAMAYGGARGDTAAEMAKTLHFAADDDKFHATFGRLVATLNAEGQEGKFQLNVANALWAQQGFAINAGYKQLVSTSYSAGLQEVDFKQQTDAARKEINAWVEKQTHDKIKDLLQRGVLTTDTRMVLTNAIYFKSAWLTQFEKHATRQAPFTRAGGQKVDVAMMHHTGHYHYGRGEGYQLLEIPYEGARISMIVMLPDRAAGLPEVEKGLSLDKLSLGLRALSERVSLSLPKFKVTSQFGLKQTLSALGMPVAFTDRADFSGIDGQRDLYLQDVVHKAFVDVNEEGTEAAAATAAVFGATSIAIGEKPPIAFTADHPFVYFIRDTGTGSLLFIGRVTEPK